MMFDEILEPFWDALPQWRSLRCGARSTFLGHGHSARWLGALAALPDATPSRIAIGDVIAVGSPDDLSDSGAPRIAICRSLQALHPWRKGPFDLFGVSIDSEWRSDMKWRRLIPHLAPLAGRRVLDVGCGNGYYGWRLRASGASLVVGIEANAGHVAQHLAVARYARRAIGGHHVLPLRFEALEPTVEFDTVLSMGVLYHQRDPLAHLERLRRFVRPGGEVAIESLIVDAPHSLAIGDARYARMKNVHWIPNLATVCSWLQQAGFDEPRVVDVTTTTADEQRSTPWMRFESLAEALDRSEPSRTVEGHPAPVRAIFVAEA